MGSLGDAWDNYISLPEEKFQEEQKHHEEIQEKRRKKNAGKRRKHNEVIFKDLVAKLHPAFIIGAIFTGLAVASVGPVYPLMPFMALIGLLATVAGLTLVQTIQKDKEGQKLGAGIAAICIFLIALSEMEITSAKYITFTQQDLSVPVTTLTEEEKFSRANQDMALMADAVSCALLVLPDDEIIGIGRETVNYRVNNDSVSFKIASILNKDEIKKEFTPVEEEFVFVLTSEKYPLDPFSDDPRATYGVYVSNGYILVYSPGPDGGWDLPPRRPLIGHEDNPVEHLDQFQWDGINGDLIYTLPVPEFSETTNSTAGFTVEEKDCNDVQKRWQEAWFNSQ